MIGPKNEDWSHEWNESSHKYTFNSVTTNIKYEILIILSQFSTDRQRKGDPADRDDPR